MEPHFCHETHRKSIIWIANEMGLTTGDTTSQQTLASSGNVTKLTQKYNEMGRSYETRGENVTEKIKIICESLHNSQKYTPKELEDKACHSKTNTVRDTIKKLSNQDEPTTSGSDSSLRRKGKNVPITYNIQSNSLRRKRSSTHNLSKCKLTKENSQRIKRGNVTKVREKFERMTLKKKSKYAGGVSRSWKNMSLQRRLELRDMFDETTEDEASDGVGTSRNSVYDELETSSPETRRSQLIPEDMESSVVHSQVSSTKSNAQDGTAEASKFEEQTQVSNSTHNSCLDEFGKELPRDELEPQEFSASWESELVCCDADDQNQARATNLDECFGEELDVADSHKTGTCDDPALCGGNWEDDVKIRDKMKWLHVQDNESKGKSRESWVYFKTVGEGAEIFGSRSFQGGAPQQGAEHQSFEGVIEYSLVDESSDDQENTRSGDVNRLGGNARVGCRGSSNRRDDKKTVVKLGTSERRNEVVLQNDAIVSDTETSARTPRGLDEIGAEKVRGGFS